jgi:SAM-dependent methyltransferase
VVGVDFSSASIEIARRRTAVAGLDDRVSFVCATVDEAPDQMPTPFDGVYTSWGALCWLPDIDAWARVVHRLLRPGGWVYVAETHPYATSTRWPDYAYGGAIAQFDDGQGDYTDAAARFEHPESWEWNHSLGEIVSALAGAGMRIEWLHEHTVAVWHLNEPEHLVRRADGLWESPGSTLPLSFSLRAVRPG